MQSLCRNLYPQLLSIGVPRDIALRVAGIKGREVRGLASVADRTPEDKELLDKVNLFINRYRHERGLSND